MPLCSWSRSSFLGSSLQNAQVPWRIVRWTTVPFLVGLFQVGCRAATESRIPTEPAQSLSPVAAAPSVAPAPSVPALVPSGIPSAAPRNEAASGGGVYFVGRTERLPTGEARFAWSGAGLRARFRGTGVSVRLRDKGNYFTVILDGQPLPRLKGDGVSERYLLAKDLPLGEHALELYRQTEALVGITTFQGLEIDQGALLPPPAAPERRIEVIGDSISCGYGVEGTHPSCKFSPETENHYLTYGAVVARNLGAELSTVAWSGKGVVSNYGGDRKEPLPELYERVIPQEATSQWGFGWQPQVVVINLSTNDFSTEHDPAESEFVPAYGALLSRVRARYPQALILCTVGPLLQPDDRDKARRYIRTAVETQQKAGDQRLRAYDLQTPNRNPGCDWHPGRETQAAMAREIEIVIRREMGWK